MEAAGQGLYASRRGDGLAERGGGDVSDDTRVSSPAFAAVVVASMFAYFGTFADFVARLEIRHHETWERFGSPKIIPMSLIKQFTLNRYVALGEFYALGDAGLNRKGMLARLSLFAVIVVIALAPIIAPAR